MKKTEDSRPGPRAKLLLLVATFLAVLVPYLFWQGTWFGRPLTDKELAEYLRPTAKPRKTQHALVQLSERMARGGTESVRKWYPSVLELGSHSVPEVRVTVAWLMGQDNGSNTFHAALLSLVRDQNPLVRRNAALSLVRFGDGAGRVELLTMLQPYRVLSLNEGVLKFRLQEEDSVSTGTLLARIQSGPQQINEIRSPLPGFVDSKLVEEGKTVSVGEAILLLSPAEEEVWEALRALFLIGQPEDLPEIERFTGRAPHMSDRIQQQARLTVAAIKQRRS
jgi:hypothetical protein